MSTQKSTPSFLPPEITLWLPDNFLAGSGLYHGDGVCIKRGGEVRNRQLGLVKVGKLLFIGYLARLADKTLEVYGPDEYEPYLSYEKGQYEIVGPVVRQIVPLTSEQRRMRGQPAQTFLSIRSAASLA